MSGAYKILFMKIIVFGATGRTGKQIVHQALNAFSLVRGTRNRFSPFELYGTWLPLFFYS